MDQQLLNFILNSNYTLNQALRRLHLLKDFLVIKLYTTDKKDVLGDISEEDNRWLSSLDEQFLQQFNKKNLYQSFQAAEEEIKKIQPLIVYVPFELPEAEAAKIGQNLRQDYGSNFMMEVKLDPSLIAGVSLTWNGIYKDYSLRKRITDNREVILNSLKSFAHK